MSERQWSIADRFCHVVAEIQKMDEDIDNDNPHRYPIRMLKDEAEKILFDAVTSAGRIADLVQVLKKEIRDMEEGKQP